jgi:D-alanyl-D-alanine carboxypeptidase
MPGLLLSKTGYTDLAGGNLVIVFDVGIGHPVAIVVLGSTRDARFTDVEKLMHATLSHFAGPTTNS